MNENRKFNIDCICMIFVVIAFFIIEFIPDKKPEKEIIVKETPVVMLTDTVKQEKEEPLVIEETSGPVIITGKKIKCDDVPLTNSELNYLKTLCEDKGIALEYALAIIQSESNFDYDAKGLAGEVGLFQIHPVNFQRMSELGIDVHTVSGNMEAGVQILSECISLESRDVLSDATMRYKCGINKGNKLIEQGNYLDVCADVNEWTSEWRDIIYEVQSDI